MPSYPALLLPPVRASYEHVASSAAGRLGCRVDLLPPQQPQTGLHREQDLLAATGCARFIHMISFSLAIAFVTSPG